ncbi:MAG: MG2 domain-containing protein [Planctomycetota bacterium]|jgi:hypothetical protein
MECAEFREKVFDFLYDALEPGEGDAVGRHAEACEACGELLETARERLRDFSAWRTPSVGKAFLEKALVAARTPKTAAPPKRSRLIRYGLLAAGTSVAAVTLFLAAYAVHVAALRTDPQDLILLTDSSLTPGTRAAARVVFRNHDSGEPLANERIHVQLVSSTDPDARAESWTVETAPDGVADLDFRVPDWPDGPCMLEARPEKEAGELEGVVKSVQVHRPFRVFLSTDKPVYRPGQEIRIRLLAMVRFRKKPLAGATATVEVLNPQSIKVFRKEVKTSSFGIASLTMPLAEELDLGAYKITAKVKGVETEKSVHVKRYVLPRFKVEIQTDKSYYLPGELVNVEVRAAYLFGKPVVGAQVRFFGRDCDPALEASGKTDEDGRFRFSGKIEAQGETEWQYTRGGRRQAIMNFAVEVVDTAGHAEKKQLEVPLAREPYNIALYAEGGRIANDVENRFYLVLTRPDGKACKARIVLTGETFGTEKLDTDEHGVASFSAVCSRSDSLAVRCTVQAPDAPPYTEEFNLGKRGHNVPFLLQPDKSVYTVGDTAVLTVLAPKTGSESLYLDVVREGQAVLMRRVDVTNGQGRVSIDLDAELGGLLILRLYRISERGTAERDTRYIFVRNDSALNVRIRMDREVYRPGDRARAVFTLEGSDGEPLAGALSLCAVDEAVFALTEIRPGFLETLFQIERAFLTPARHVLGARGLPIREMVSGPNAQAAAAFSALTPSVEAPVQPPSSYRNKRSMVEAEKRNKSEFLEKAVVFTVGIVAILLFFGLPPIAVIFYSERSPWTRVITGGWAFLVLFTCCGLSLPELFRTEYMAHDDPGPPRAAKREATRTIGPSRPEPGEPESPRVRKDFPETLLWVDELITDEKGHAEIEFPLADSITTWRLTAQAVSDGTGLGSAAAPIRVFQDFFIDIDLPAELTRNDEIELPAVVYNYLETREKVRLLLEADEGVEILGSAEAELSAGPGKVLSTAFRIRATRVGRRRLRLRGFGRTLSDAVEREIRVVPDGRAEVQATSDLLGDETVEIDFSIPGQTIPGSATAVLKLYPGPCASALEGLEQIVRMPYG